MRHRLICIDSPPLSGTYQPPYHATIMMSPSLKDIKLSSFSLISKYNKTLEDAGPGTRDQGPGTRDQGPGS